MYDDNHAPEKNVYCVHPYMTYYNSGEIYSLEKRIDFMFQKFPNLQRESTAILTTTRQIVSYSSGSMAKVFNEFTYTWDMVAIDNIKDDLIAIEAVKLKIYQSKVRFIVRINLYDKFYMMNIDVDDRMVRDEKYRGEMFKIIENEAKHKLFKLISSDMILDIGHH